MARQKRSTEEFVAWLKTNAAYSHIDIDHELGKALAWCEVNNRQCTERFFVNWLNRIEKPLAPIRRFDPGRDPVDAAPDIRPCPTCGDNYCLKLHRNK